MSLQSIRMLAAGIAAFAGFLSGALAADGPTADGPIEGRVFDESGQPVPGVEVGFYWNANSWFDETGERRPVLDVWKHVGGMRTSRPPVTTDASGRFTLKAVAADRHRSVLAMDAERRRGGTGRANEQEHLTIRLQPLTRVHGRVRRADSGKLLEWSGASVLTPQDRRYPLTGDRLAMCGSYDGHFEFLLPPGDYLLEGYGEAESGDMYFKMRRPQRITVNANGRDLEVGDLSVDTWNRDAEVAKADVPAGDYRELYGHPTPNWHATGARAISVNVRPSDFEGRWVVLYFWGMDCLPCLREGVPKLMAFSERHRDANDRFKIVTIFEGRDVDGFTTIEDLNRWLEPIEQRIWKRELTLPVLLETTYRTRKSYGFEYYGTAVLIDPSGKLVRVEPAEDGEMLTPILNRVEQEMAGPLASTVSPPPAK